MKKALFVLIPLVIVIAVLLAVFLAPKEQKSGQLTFELNRSKGSYAVIDCDDDASGELEIPSTFKGKSVTAIGKQAFQGCTGITAITIPSSVTTIGDAAFDGCTGLTELTIPNSVTNIGEGAFAQCTNLTHATISNRLTSVRHRLFSGCSALTEIIIPEGVTTIGNEAFLSCTSMTEINVPASVTKIHDSAFEHCSGLETVFYGGAKLEWEKVDVREWNDDLTASYIYYKCSGNKVYLTVTAGAAQEEVRAVYLQSGDVIKFVAEAAGTDLKYQWQFSTDGTTWINCSYRADREAYDLIARTRHNTDYYRCAITDAAGNVSYSNVLFLHVQNLAGQTATQSGSTKAYAVTAVNATTGIKVSWKEMPGAKSYTVCKSTFVDGAWSDWLVIATVVNETLYADTSVTPATQVKYMVTADNDNGNYDENGNNYDSNGNNAFTYKESAPLKYLTTPTVTAVNATAGVKVSWDAIYGAETYNIYRSILINGHYTEWTKIAVDVTDTVYMDTGAVPGTIVKYTARAASGDDRSSYKGGNAVKYLMTPTVTAANTTNGVQVTWNNITGAETYNIYRSICVNGNWASWEAIATNVVGTTYVDSTVAPNTEVKYTVRAVSGGQKSSYAGGNAVTTN